MRESLAQESFGLTNYRLKRLGQTDEMLALGLKLLFLANLLKGGYVPFCRLASLLSFRWLLQKSIPVNP